VLPGLGGCLGRLESTTGESERSDPNTNNIPTDCDSSYERIAVERPPVTNQLDGLVLTTGANQVQVGGDISVSFINNSESDTVSGTRSKYDIQRRTNTEWESIFWTQDEDMIGYQDNLVSHSPGSGFSWEFTMAQNALSHEIQHGHGQRTCCESLEPGSYRFVFFGKTTYDAADPEVSLGAEFDVTET
jgi:hypothetical protein